MKGRRTRQRLAAVDLDRLPARKIARLINREDARVAAAVHRALPQIARAIEAIVRGFEAGGRLIYVGAGTSGRVAALDAVECPPTFGSDPRMVQFVMAGGSRALGRAAETSEDSRAAGRRDLAGRKPGRKDVVVGISAGGQTSYTVSALQHARVRGATTVAVTCNQNSELARTADIAIVTDVGPEVVVGSSRMKAGTAQKMVLNMLSTGAMARMGYVFGNLMVKVQIRNRKLRERGLDILETAGGLEGKAARQALAAAGERVPVALVMRKAKVSRREAQQRLRTAGGHVRHAIEGSTCRPRRKK